MGRIRTGVVTVVAAAMMMASGCSDELAGEAAPPTADPSTPLSAFPSPTTSGLSAAEAAPDTRSPAELIAAGRGTYNANCIACHSMDPRQDGALGPAVAGASPELIDARVMRAAYPVGYVPKRETKVMVPLPHLKAKLPEITAYLDSLK